MAEKLTEAGDNVTPETFLEFYRQIRSAKRKMEEAGSEYRHARKRAEKAGIDLKGLALLEQLAKLDSAEAEARLRNTMRYAGWAQLPLGTQITLFGETVPAPTEKAKQQHNTWAAEEAGYDEGKSGGTREANPYTLGTEAAAAWDKGWLNGHDAWAKLQGDDVLGSGKRRPGRRRRQQEAAAA